MIITIDGPAGAGKSTAAKQLARRLGVAYLDTGATYRAATLAALREGVDMQDAPALTALAGRIDVSFEYDAGALVVRLDGQDVSRAIRSADVSDNSHYLAAVPGVREVLVGMQRRIATELCRAAGGVVVEGRDQGSVVFPDADVKFYLDAAPAERARRRCRQMAGGGESAEYEDVLRAILTRDGRDSTRPVAPLVRPEGAIEIDTTDNTIEETADELLRRVREAS